MVAEHATKQKKRKKATDSGTMSENKSRLPQSEMAIQYDETVKKKISALELGSKLRIIGNQTDVSQLINNSLITPVPGESLSKTVKEWQQELLAYLKIVSPTPKVSKDSFRDARELFGDNFKTKVTLRKSGHLGAYEEISLLQFDPNFTSSEVICRHPSCSTKNPHKANIGSKRDLFLCPIHRQVLRENISDLLAKEEIKLSTSAKKPEHGHFAGYTSLIGLLEGAYHDAKKFQTLKEESPLVQEAILNVRNFLIITNCLLNPDADNSDIALPPVVKILRLILQNPDATNQLGVGLIYVLREVIEMILFSFGVIYTWVALALSNPGAQIGAGVGAILGASAFFLGPLSGAAGVVVIGAAGGLIGNGIHSLITGGQRNQELQQFRQRWREAGGDIPGNGQPNNQYLVYYFEGDVAGGLDLFPADL